MERGSLGRAGFTLLRLAAGGIFVYAGVLKASTTPQFAVDISHYRLLSWDAAVLLALYLPWLEIFAGAGVIVKRLYGGALAVLIGLTLLFMVAIGTAAARSLDIACGCFGAGSGRVSYTSMIVRDSGILCALLVLALLDRGGRPSPNHNEPIAN